VTLRVAVLLLLLVGSWLPAGQANAAESTCPEGSTSNSGVRAGGTGFAVHASTGSDSCIDSPASSGNQTFPQITTVGDDACYGLMWALSESPDFCEGSSEPVVTAGMVSEALRRVPLPAARLQVQPPNGRTLVNFATNFYTEREEFTRHVRLLGQRIELRITPGRFTWHFDDGESTTTTSPGSPYPDLEVTHDYLEATSVSPSVDTTYTAEFRVGGGSWQPVPGSVTIPGEAVGLEVVEASPILVGYN
jgi:hypothetical protein